MRTISNVWEKLYVNLGQIDPKYPLRNKVVRRTMGPSGYKRQAETIIEELDPQDSALEIGCGFGGLALEILKLIRMKYTVVDNNPMLMQTKKYLGDKVEYIEAKKIETLQDRKYGLFISNSCLSETPSEYRKYILENIIKNCQRLFIIDRNDIIISKPEIFFMNIEEWIEKYFTIKKSYLKKNQTMYIGKRKKA